MTNYVNDKEYNTGGHYSPKTYTYTLTWQNIHVWAKEEIETSKWYWQNVKYKNVQILDNVSGVANHGSLVAIMGPSGSGKTTFLTTISHRRKDNVSGNIFVNGQRITREMMIKISGFVPKIDITIDTLTVFEHLTLMASLRMDRRLQKCHRLTRIKSLMEDLAIAHCSETYIKNLSGGEKRRVSLAVQMITDPLFLFCDEPTTGLDSYNAQSVMKVLQRLSHKGKIILCSIHQPAAGVYELFNQVVLIAAGGKVAYQGPVTQAPIYFERLDMKCPLSYNIAEFLVSKLLIINQEDSQRVGMLCDIFPLSEDGKDVKNRIHLSLKITNDSNHCSSIYHQEKTDSFEEFSSIKSATLWTQFWYLTWRYNINARRKTIHHIANLAGYLFVGFVLTSFNYNSSISSQSSIQNVQGLILLSVCETVYQYSFYAICTFEQDIPVMLREMNNGMYRAGPYYLCRVFCTLGYCITEPLLYAAMIYQFTNVFKVLPFIQFSLVYILACMVATSYGMLLSSIFKSINLLLTVSVIYECAAYIMSGTQINLASLSFPLTLLKYFSIFYYGTAELSVLEWTNINYIPCEDDCSMRCISTGIDVLKSYGYKTSGRVFDLLSLVGIIVLFHTISFIFICRRSKQPVIY